MATSRPSWMTDELEEEWPMPEQTPSPSSSSRNPAPSSLRYAPPPSSFKFSGPVSSLKELEPEPSIRAPGTFIVRTNVEDDGPLTPIGPLAKFKGMGKSEAGILNSFFSPLPLESMFEPPSPSSGSETAQSPLEHRSTSPPLEQQPNARNSFSSSFNTNHSSESSTPQKPLDSFAEETPSSLSPSPSPSPSPLPRAPPTNSQLSHVPQRPSRLAKGFTPEDMTASTIEPADQSGVEVGQERDVASARDVPSLGRFNGSKLSSGFEFDRSSSRNNKPLNSFNSFNTAVYSVDQQPTEEYDQTVTYPYQGIEESDEDPPENYLISQTEATTRPEPQKLQLFQPQLNTFTRECLSAMVDNIKASSASPSSIGASSSSSLFHHSRSSTSSAEYVQSVSILSDDVSLRSSKRVKLSPPPPVGGEGSTRSLERLRRSKSSVGADKRDWQKESQEMVAHVKEVGKGRSGEDTLEDQEQRFGARGGRVGSGFEARGGEGEGKDGDRNGEGDESGRQRLEKIEKRDFADEPPLSNATKDEPNALSTSPSYSPGKLPSVASSYARQDQTVSTRIRSSDHVLETLLDRLDLTSLKDGGLATKFPTSSTVIRPYLNASSQPRQSELVPDLPRAGTGIPSRPTSQQTTTSAQALSPSTKSVAPPVLTVQVPTSSTDDMNRFVSSSTVQTMVAQSTMSSSSYTKHPGPAQRPRMISIPLTEAETPYQVGKMIFDREKMVWVKSRGSGETGWNSSEDDPFKDMDSSKSIGLRTLSEETEEGSSSNAPLANSPRSLLNTLPLDPRLEKPSSTLSPSRRPFNRSISITSNSFEDPKAPIDEQDGFDMDEVAASMESFQFPESPSPSSVSSKNSTPPSSPPRTRPPPPQHAQSAPLPYQTVTSTPLPTQQPRGRISSTGGLRPFVTPVSVLKKRSPQGELRSATPGSALYGRSVSFSDGRKTGKLKDPQVQRIELAWDGKGEDQSVDVDKSFVGTSARASRIQRMLNELGEDESTDSEDDAHGHDTPSKVVQTDSSLARLSMEGDPDMTNRSIAPTSRSFHYNGRKNKPGDATFLTECSFGATRDRLVEIITDVYPFVPYWDEMTVINLEGKQAGSVARMKEFLPKLIEANLDHNDLTYLSGVPSSVETLRVAHNRLSSLTAVAHLMNLEYLDLSNNQLDSVNQLTCLRHLRELKVDNNFISDLTPLFAIDNLIQVSAVGNKMSSASFLEGKWTRLEFLDLSSNQIGSVQGLQFLPNLKSITLDDNRLQHFEFPSHLRKLRCLKISDNKLARLDIGLFPQLRILYADQNRLQRTNHSAKSTKLERLSLRNQEGGQLSLSAAEMREVKRLFVSGTPISPSFFNQRCPNLVYLEMAACKLSVLSHDFSSFAVNIRNLNLNYNFLTDISPLQDLQSLTKLSVVGSRLEATQPVVRVLRTLPSLQMVDLRMNPCTLALYLPLMINNTSTAVAITSDSPSPSPSDGTLPSVPSSSASWAELDVTFRRSLPDNWYVRRLAHRGFIMQACPKVSSLDGVIISEGERKKADELLNVHLASKPNILD